MNVRVFALFCCFSVLPIMMSAQEPAPAPGVVAPAAGVPAAQDRAAGIQDVGGDVKASRKDPPKKGKVIAPVLLKESAVDLTLLGKRLSYSGKGTEVRAVVSTDGIPQDISVVKTCGEALVDLRAMDAVGRYRFRPGSLDGKLVRVELYIMVNLPDH